MEELDAKVKTLRDILLAMVNATLVLAIVLVIGLIVLVGRVVDLRDNTAAMAAAAVAPYTDQLDRATTSLENIDAQLASMDGSEIRALRDDITALRGSLPNLSTMDDVTAQTLAMQIMRVIGQMIQNTPSPMDIVN